MGHWVFICKKHGKFKSYELSNLSFKSWNIVNICTICLMDHFSQFKCEKEPEKDKIDK